MEPSLNCREAARLLSLALDRALSAEESEALGRHLARCLACRTYGDQVAFLRKAAGRFREGGA